MAATLPMRALRVLLMACVALSANACATAQGVSDARPARSAQRAEHPVADAATSDPAGDAATPDAAALQSPPHPNPLPRARGRGSKTTSAGNATSSLNAIDSAATVSKANTSAAFQMRPIAAPSRDVATSSNVAVDDPLSPARGGEGWGEGAPARATIAANTNTNQPASAAAVTDPGATPTQALSQTTPTATQPAPAATIARAARTAPATAAPKPSSASAVGSTVFALLLIVALIFGLAWLARRMPGVGAQAGGALRIVGSLALSPRERVVVVDVGGQHLLLSTGTGGTRLLQALDAPLPTASAPSFKTPSFKPFAQVLAQQFGRTP